VSDLDLLLAYTEWENHTFDVWFVPDLLTIDNRELIDAFLDSWESAR